MKFNNKNGGIFFYNRFTTLLTIIFTLFMLFVPEALNYKSILQVMHSHDLILISLFIAVCTFQISTIALVMGGAIHYVFTGK